MSLDPITAGIGLVDTFIGKFVKDKDLAQKLKAAAKSEEFSGELQLLVGQMEINKVEAAHKSLFVAGSRPFIMWVCGIGLLYNVLLYPVLNIWFDMPPIDTELLYPPLMGLLGLGAMRSFEKAKGVARER
jgi:hypothetical protein